MLRKISEIAEVCNTSYQKVKDVIQKENILPVRDRPCLMFDEYQQNYIFHILYIENKMQYLTFESSMNKEVDYSYRKDFIKNGNLTPVG